MQIPQSRIDDLNKLARRSPEEIRSLIRQDEICSSFEDHWDQDSVSQIEQLAFQVQTQNRSALVYELLSIDFELRQSTDKQLSLQKYVVQLPNFSPTVTRTIQSWRTDTQTNEPTVEHETTVPEKIGDYRIVQLIGEGGAGVVYEAIQKSLNRRVAIKTLNHPHIASQVSRFQQEARAIAMLHHTNIVDVYGSGFDDGVPYIAMQLIDGNGLDELIELARERVDSKSHEIEDDFLHGKHGQRNIARIGSEVANALSHAHQLGVLHRDIKPSNLIVDNKGITCVSDFGLAKLCNEDSGHTLGGIVLGTMRYVPPEAFSGQWSERSDIYSLGVTLYELLTLTPPYQADDQIQLVKQISLHNLVKPLRQADDSISKDMETIVTKAMSFEPENRYQSAAEMADELNCLLTGKPIKSRPIPLTESLWRWAKRKPAAAALASLVGVVAFIGLPIVFWLWLTASSALKVAEESRRDSEASRYSSGVLLAGSYIEDGRASDAKRLLGELKSSSRELADKQSELFDRWELAYLYQKLDTSKLTLKGDEKYDVWHVTIRPDDKQIATVHNGDPLHSDLDGEVILWDSQTGKKEHVLRNHGSRVYGCQYSHDGKQLATIGFNHDPDADPNFVDFLRGSVCLWDVKSGERINMVDLAGRYSGEYLYSFDTRVLPGVIFSDDDRKLITWPGTLEVFETSTLKSLWRRPRYFAATILSNERVLAAAGDGESLVEFDLTSGEKLASTEADLVGLNRFSISAAKTKLAGKAVKAIRVWDLLESIEESVEIAVPSIYWSTISPDGSQIAYSTRKGDVHIQPVSQSERLGTHTLLGHDSTVTSGAYSSNGQWMVTASVDGTAKVWDLISSQSNVKTNLMHDHIASISFADDGKQVVYSARKTDGPTQLNNVGKFSLDNSQFSTASLDTTYKAPYPRNDFTFTRDGSRFAAPIAKPSKPTDIHGYCETGTVGIWSTAQWKKLHAIDTQLSEVLLTAWSADNRLLAVSGTQNGVNKIQFYLIEESIAQPAGAISSGLADIESIVFHDRQQFAAGSSDEILIWKLSATEATTNKPSSLAFGQPKRIGAIGAKGERISLDFSPDGSHLASADFTNDLLQVFNVEAGTLCFEQPGPRRFCCVRYSPCGKRLALSGFDAIVHLCDAEFGYRLLTLNGCSDSPGTFSINSKVSFSPDGRKIATNNWLGEIAVWEIDVGEETVARSNGRNRPKENSR